jgi:arrestin-related trafficking adapter 3/6
MWRYSSNQMADEDYWYPCLLVPLSTGFLRAPSHRGRLYYLPNDTAGIASAPGGRFPNRVAQPSALCIASVAAESNVSRSAVSKKTPGLSGKLARSREQAKRFLRLTFSSNATPPVQPVPFHPPREGFVDGVEAGDMVFADAGRRSPIRRERGSPVVGGPVSGMVQRPNLADNVRRASVSSVKGEPNISITSLANEKPIVSGNGVAISISLAEPVLYLQGFDPNDTSSRSTTMLRGSMLLRVSKQAKIKTISLNFRGRSETDWPEGETLEKYYTSFILIIL